MASRSDPHRHYLLCPVCTRTQSSLSVHLRRVCMKSARPGEIVAAVQKAKEEARDILMTGRVFSYVTLQQILEDADPLSRLLEELQRRHMPLTGVPPPLPRANVPPTSSAGIVAPGSGEGDQASAGSRETFKVHSMLTDSSLTPNDCLAVLRAAKKDMLSVIGKAMEAQSPALDGTQCVTVCSYLQAVVILKHLQRPGVVESMTVEEWCLRQQVNGYTIIGVNEHKTAARQVAAFALSQEEDSWFEMYFTKVRPLLLQSERDEMEEEEMEEEVEDRFFVSSSGKPIHNASDDLNRLHARYNLKPVSSQMARRVFQTSTKNMPDSQKSLLADYLTHSTTTAESHDRTKQPEDVMEVSQLLAQMVGDSSVESGLEEASSSDGAALRGDGGSREGSFQITEEFDKLIKIHPVTIDGTAPIQFLKKYDRPTRKILCGRWVKAQKKLRVQRVLSHFSGHPTQPSEGRVSKYIHKQGWEASVPKAADVLGRWKPPGATATLLDMKLVRKLTSKQAWRGLLVQDMPGKGEGVVTTRAFQMGEVVCDYHGELFTEEETPADTGSMFFYRTSKGKLMCIDARKDSCDCHPGVQTFGRMINSSRKNHNLRPRPYAVEDEEGETDLVLFMASRDIAVGEELLFDCRVKTGSR